MDSSLQGEGCGDRRNSPARVEGLYPGSQTRSNELLGHAVEWERGRKRVVKQFQRACDFERRPNAPGALSAHRGPAARTTCRAADCSRNKEQQKCGELSGVA